VATPCRRRSIASCNLELTYLIPAGSTGQRLRRHGPQAGSLGGKAGCCSRDCWRRYEPLVGPIGLRSDGPQKTARRPGCRFIRQITKAHEPKTIGGPPGTAKTRSNRLSCRRRSVNSLHWTGSPTRTGRMWLVVCITGRSSDTIHQQAAHKNAGSFASQRPCHVDFAAAEGFREAIISSVWRIPNDHSPFRYSTRSFLSLSERLSLRCPS
jgi:hypothetical protein